MDHTRACQGPGYTPGLETLQEDGTALTRGTSVIFNLNESSSLSEVGMQDVGRQRYERRWDVADRAVFNGVSFADGFLGNHFASVNTLLLGSLLVYVLLPCAPPTQTFKGRGFKEYVQTLGWFLTTSWSSCKLIVVRDPGEGLEANGQLDVNVHRVTACGRQRAHTTYRQTACLTQPFSVNGMHNIHHDGFRLRCAAQKSFLRKYTLDPFPQILVLPRRRQLNTNRWTL